MPKRPKIQLFVARSAAQPKTAIAKKSTIREAGAFIAAIPGALDERQNPDGQENTELEAPMAFRPRCWNSTDHRRVPIRCRCFPAVSLGFPFSRHTSHTGKYTGWPAGVSWGFSCRIPRNRRKRRP